MENQLAHSQLKDLWRLAGGNQEALSHVRLPGQDPIYPSSFYIGTAAQVSIAAAALAASEVWRQKSGTSQTVSIETKHAAIESRSERYFRVNSQGAPSLWDPLAGLYSTGDGRFVRLHTNFPHHKENILKLLACDATREAVQNKLSHWNSFEFESLANSSGCVVAALRSRKEWLEHPQAQAIETLPVILLEKISDAPARPLPDGPRPLSNFRVLDLTRILAGPVGTRVLAAYGANVLRIHSPKLPALEWADRDTGRGKRSAYLDLTTATDRDDLKVLIHDADIFFQAYRPEGVASKGFGPEELARIRPGIVYVSLSAYSHLGPWASNRGFDSLVQTATGFNVAEAEAFGLASPKELPCQAIDHASGYLMALGAIMARLKQAQEGGSWHVRVSLAQTGNWIWKMGQSAANLKGCDFKYEEISDLIENTSSEFGEVSAVRHAASFSQTPAHWAKPVTRLGADKAQW